jgi:hypothetical protein
MWVQSVAVASTFLASAVTSVEVWAQYEPGAPASTVNLPPQRSVAAEAQSRERDWYGWQTLLNDFGVISGLYLYGKSDNPTFAYLAFGAYALAPPTSDQPMPA